MYLLDKTTIFIDVIFQTAMKYLDNNFQLAVKNSRITKNEPTPLTTEHIQGPFILLALGNILAFVALLVEHLVLILRTKF